MDEMRNLILRESEESGIGEIGIIKCRRFEELIPILEKREIEGKLTGFEEGDIENRIDPKRIMEDCKSIIVGIFPYYSDEKEKGNLARYSRGIDYHFVIKDILDRLGEKIKEQVPEFQWMSYADSGPLVDRHLAYSAGLGFWGINGNLINKEYGSYILVGYMITNHEFKEYDEPIENESCIECMRCISACPGRAITGDKDINPLKCKSYITQKKGELSQEEMDIIKGSEIVFGCDVCQEVCPHNKGIKMGKIGEFIEEKIDSITKEDVQELSNKKFKKVYGNRAFAWRGRKIIERNIDIIKEK